MSSYPSEVLHIEAALLNYHRIRNLTNGEVRRAAVTFPLLINAFYINK
jgi:hypothetical protein